MHDHSGEICERYSMLFGLTPTAKDMLRSAQMLNSVQQVRIIELQHVNGTVLLARKCESGSMNHILRSRLVPMKGLTFPCLE